MTRDLGKLEISKDHLKKVQKNLTYNSLIGSFYEQLQDEQRDALLKNRLEKKLERLQDCNRFWEIDRYDIQKVKDFIRTNLCRDKFCNNCKKVKQAERMARFIPEIHKYKNHHMSQLVLTVPNCSGDDLHKTIQSMFKAFGRLIEYFKGYKKIKGLNFDWLGYMGALRSLEVTYKKDYHPHLHVLLIHDGLDGEKKNINKYSYDMFGKKEIRRFSDFEILVQKIWYLLTNNSKVTKKAIEELELGYSCMMDKFQEGDFLELFKYMTKSDGLEDGKIMSYQNFKDLYYGLHSVRQIQGYGCLFRLKDEDMAELADSQYQALINDLRQKENPVNVSQTVQDLISDSEYLLISRKQIYKHLKRL